MRLKGRKPYAKAEKLADPAKQPETDANRADPVETPEIVTNPAVTPEPDNLVTKSVEPPVPAKTATKHVSMYTIINRAIAEDRHPDVQYARECAWPYTQEMIEIMVDIARNSASDMARLVAADKVLTRSSGKEATYGELQKIDKSANAVTWVDIIRRKIADKKKPLPEPEILQ